jgi:hypothetical protein
MKIFGREPALILGLVYSAIALFGGYVFHLTIDQEGTLNIVAAAVIGIILAVMARSDGLAAALLSFAKALMAATISFGAHLTPELQGIVMTFVASVIAVFTRQAITAPVAANE